MADLSKLSDADLMALHSGDLSKVSNEGLMALNDGGQSPAPQAAPQAPKPLGAVDGMMALPESALHLLSGSVAAPVAGFRGMYTMARNALGLSNDNPADVVNRTQEAMTYQPRTQGGQMISNAIAYPFQKLAQGAQYVGGAVNDATGSPALATAVDTGIQSLPMLVGGKLLSGTNVISPKTVAAAPEAVAARSAGFSLTPAQAGGVVGKTIESIVGPAKLERIISKKNAPVVNEIAGNEIGIPSGQPINAATINAAKAPHNAVYQQVSQLGQVAADPQFQADVGGITNRTGAGSFGFNVSPQVENLRQGFSGVQSFDAGDAVAQIKQLRKDSRMNGKIYDPEKQALGYAQKGVADALENQLDRHVQTLSQQGLAPPDLIQQFRDSRQALAKIHNVEDAMVGPNVSAKAIFKAGDRGVPLSGGLKTIADSYQNFDRSFQDVSKIRDSGPFGYLDALVGAGAGMANPAAFSAILARPLARQALATDAFQNIGIAKGSSWPGIPASTIAPISGALESDKSYGLPGIPLPYITQ